MPRVLATREHEVGRHVHEPDRARSPAGRAAGRRRSCARASPIADEEQHARHAHPDHRHQRRAVRAPLDRRAARRRRSSPRAARARRCAPAPSAAVRPDSSGPPAAIAPAPPSTMPTTCSARGWSPAASPPTTGTTTPSAASGETTPIVPDGQRRVERHEPGRAGGAREHRPRDPAGRRAELAGDDRRDRRPRAAPTACDHATTATAGSRRETTPPRKSADPHRALLSRARRAATPRQYVRADGPRRLRDGAPVRGRRTALGRVVLLGVGP